MIKAFRYFSLVILLYSLSSCHGDYSPKPKSYPRVIFPERKFAMYDAPACPFKFELPVYARIQRDSSAKGMQNPCWLNIVFPDFNGTVNLTYKEITKENTLEQLLEDAHKLSFKHTKKANYIDESFITNKHGVSGIFYNVGGDAASNVQFFLTDSSHHFIRGSLYFYNEPNSDSMAPVLTYVRQDLDTILNTFQWK
ncbi:MAG: gliding motility lipoprotein GldD [Bacteroidetes bacterium]|nr:gliding motility lipoprotein GldD [Bacteroidota bacterium]